MPNLFAPIFLNFGGSMKKFSLIGTGLFFLLLAFGGNALAFSVSFDQIVSSEGTTITTFHIKIRDGKLRVESEFGGMPQVMIRNDSGQFSYMPTQNMATKIPAAMQQRTFADDLPDYAAFLKNQNAVLVGSEKLENQDTDIYEFKDPVNLIPTKVWVWKEKQFPVKIEVKAPQGSTMIELKNIQFDPQLEESMFQLPPNVEIMDLSKMKATAPGTGPPPPIPSPASADEVKES